MIPLWQGSVHITRKNVLASRCLRLSLGDEKVPSHTPTSPLRLFWWSGGAKVLLVYASLLQMYCCDQACVFGTFHTLFIWKIKALPFALSHIIWGSLLISSQIPFLSISPKIFRLTKGLLSGNYKIWLSPASLRIFYSAQQAVLQISIFHILQ